MLNVEKCVACGQFMNCDEIDARCVFTPDSEYTVERTEWTCGSCVRRERDTDDEHPSGPAPRAPWRG